MAKEIKKRVYSEEERDQLLSEGYELRSRVREKAGSLGGGISWWLAKKVDDSQKRTKKRTSKPEGQIEEPPGDSLVSDEKADSDSDQTEEV